MSSDPYIMPEVELCSAKRDYVEQYPRGGQDWEVAVLMAHVGLTGVDAGELGGNHPYRVQEVFAQQASDPDVTPDEIVNRPRYNKTKPREDLDLLALKSMIRDNGNGNRNGGAPQNPIMLARQVEAYRSARNLSAREAAHELGFSRSHVLNLMRLLTLPECVQDYVRDGQMSAGHGRAIAKMRDPEAMARLIINRNLSVRQAETLARRLRYITPDGEMTRETAIPYSHHAEQLMESALGMKVRFKDRAGRGVITIAYNSPEQAQSIVDKLTATYFDAGVESL